MSSLTYIERPRSTGFCTVAEVKLDLGITSPARDSQIEEYIEEISSDIVAYCGREFARASVVERLSGDGSRSLMVSLTPIVECSDVAYRSCSFADFLVYNADAGILYHANTFRDTRPVRQQIEPHIVNDLAAIDFSATYTGGYLMPGDDVLASGTLSVVASGILRLSAGEWPILVSGDVIRTTGFATASNNRRMTVQALDGLDCIVAETLVDETEGAIVLVRVRTLPASLNGIARQLTRDRFLARNRDGDVVSEKIGDWSATYRGGAGSSASTSDTSDGGFGPEIGRKLRQWQRVHQ